MNSTPAQPEAAPQQAGSQITQFDGMPFNLATGAFELGHLVPQGLAVELGPEMEGVVFPVSALGLDVLNRDYNPWQNKPKTAAGVPAIGHISDPSSIFNAKTQIPIRDIVEGVIKANSEQTAVAMKPVIDLLSPLGILDMPVHQYPVPGSQGNRVVFYGGERKHGDIDKLIGHLGERNLRVVKLMCHLDCSATGKPGVEGGSQGGAISDIVKEGVGGATHLGGFSLGYIDGTRHSVKSDWPSDYGRLDDSHRDYNAHLLAIDYAQGTHDPIPARDLASYRRNADMWDCCAGMLVPFAGHAEHDPFSSYKYNPLEVHDQASALRVAKAMASLDQATFLGQCGSFYCAEGQFSVANLGPQEATLLKKSTWGGTPYGKVIEYFSTAEEYAGMTPEQIAMCPEIGWKHLLKNNVISQKHYNHLEQTDRIAIPLAFISEDVKGWQAYRPKNADGLIARPMTVATLAWGHLRRYMPREAIAQLIAMDINRACEAGGPAITGAVRQLVGLTDPAVPTQAGVAGFAAKIATGVLLQVLSSPETRGTLLKKAGYGELASAEDKKKVDDAYDSFIALIAKTAATPGMNLPAALAEADRHLSKIEVTRKVTNFAGQVADDKALMLYAAPHCFGIWAQNPLMAETECIRYVATAMHVDQKAAASAATT